jgi:hypothetical protein
MCNICCSELLMYHGLADCVVLGCTTLKKKKKKKRLSVVCKKIPKHVRYMLSDLDKPCFHKIKHDSQVLVFT